ncbi:hypothetical protein Q9966_014712 [Columba livia]|nr:hypothetical protein Q9966_014712 [Columba livia]
MAEKEERMKTISWGHQRRQFGDPQTIPLLSLQLQGATDLLRRCGSANQFLSDGQSALLPALFYMILLNIVSSLEACDSHLMHSRRSDPKNPAKAVLQVGIRLITTLGSKHDHGAICAGGKLKPVAWQSAGELVPNAVLVLRGQYARAITSLFQQDNPEGAETGPADSSLDHTLEHPLLQFTPCLELLKPFDFQEIFHIKLRRKQRLAGGNNIALVWWHLECSLVLIPHPSKAMEDLKNMEKTANLLRGMWAW